MKFQQQAVDSDDAELVEAFATTFGAGDADLTGLLRRIQPHRARTKLGAHGREWDIHCWALPAAPSAGADAAPPVALCMHGHGHSCCVTSWARFFKPLHDAGFHVLALDAPCFGRSGGTADESGNARLWNLHDAELVVRLLQSFGAVVDAYNRVLSWHLELLTLSGAQLQARRAASARVIQSALRRCVVAARCGRTREWAEQCRGIIAAWASRRWWERVQRRRRRQARAARAVQAFARRRRRLRVSYRGVGVGAGVGVGGPVAAAAGGSRSRVVAIQARWRGCLARFRAYACHRLAQQRDELHVHLAGCQGGQLHRRERDVRVLLLAAWALQIWKIVEQLGHHEVDAFLGAVAAVDVCSPEAPVLGNHRGGVARGERVRGEDLDKGRCAGLLHSH